MANRIKSNTQDSIIGNVYTLDYAAHCNHVRSVSLCPETVLMQYEHGSRVRKADERIDGYPDTEYGKLVSIQYKPNSDEALTALLQRERKEGVCYREGCANVYIARVS